jgi:hypothetical protein
VTTGIDSPVEGRRAPGSLMPELIPACMAAYFLVLTFLAVYRSGIPYSSAILVIDAAVTSFWVAVLAVRWIRRGGSPSPAGAPAIWNALLIAGILWYVADACWNSGYLSLYAASRFFSGESHIDTLFHSAVTESIRNYHIPSALLNDARYLPYHFGSHALLALISAALGLPAFVVYNYLYPIVFCPVFFSLLLRLVLEIKRLRNSPPIITPPELLVLLTGLVGIFPTFFLKRIGIWNDEVFISESFLAGLTAALWFLLLCMRAESRKRFERPGYRTLFLWLIVPVFVLACSALKISIGMLLAAAASYYIIRKLGRGATKYLLVALYAGVLILSSRLFSGNSRAGFRLLDFMRANVDSSAWIWYVVNTYVFAFLFIYLGVRQKGRVLEAMKGRHLLPEEVLFVVCVAGSLPGLFLSVASGSAAYFSMVAGVLVMPFIVGYERLKPGRSMLAGIAGAVLTVNLLFGADAVLFARKVVGERIKLAEHVTAADFKKAFLGEMRKGNLPGAVRGAFAAYFSPMEGASFAEFERQLDDVNKLAGPSRGDAAAFLPPESQLWNLQQNGKASPFVVPAYTGLLLMNAVYSEKGYLHDGGGGTIGKTADFLGYGLDRLKASPQKDLQQCIEEATARGFRRLIVLDDPVRVIMLPVGTR